MDCVEVCPVDCFYEGENMLVIHPDECIDCGVCEPECPAEAIKPDTEPGLEKWLELNRDSLTSGRTSQPRRQRRRTPNRTSFSISRPTAEAATKAVSASTSLPASHRLRELEQRDS